MFYLFAALIYLVGLWAAYQRAVIYIPKARSRRIVASATLAFGALMPLVFAVLYLVGVTNSGIYVAAMFLSAFVVLIASLIMSGAMS